MTSEQKVISIINNILHKQYMKTFKILTITLSILLIVVGWVLSEDSDKYSYFSVPMLALGIIGVFYSVVRWRR